MWLGTDHVLKPGDMVVLFPEDAHMPCVAAEGPAQMKKAVFKIRV